MKVERPTDVHKCFPKTLHLTGAHAADPVMQAVNNTVGYSLKLESDLLVVWVTVQSLQLFLGFVGDALPGLTIAPADLPVVRKNGVVVGAVAAIDTLSLEEFHTNVH